MCKWKEILIRPDDSLEHAIKVLHEGGCRVALVVDEYNKLLGMVTDGDIRRALIKKMTMDSEIRLVMNSEPIKANDLLSHKDLLSLMTEKSLIHMPIVDKFGALIGLETLQHLVKSSSRGNPVLLMAGGFGTRLYPLTKNTPKPLLKVGEKPILETIISQFAEHGFYNFYISTHFESEQIKKYFKDGSQYGINIQYIYEDEPLGTAGSLGLLPKDISDLPIIIMNGDLLTKIDFNHLLDFHNNNNFDATVCVREYDFQVPYGVIEIDGYNIKKIKEKPVHKFFVNAGIYVINKSLMEDIDGGTYLDMTDFLGCKLNKEKIGAFPVHEYWLDIGRIEEYERANKDVITVFSEET
jgi:dTDP-glucose pyrophosphorylase/CBS domain-containing protein